MSDNSVKTPVAPLRILSLDGFRSMAEKVDKHISASRKAKEEASPDNFSFTGYYKESYLVDASVPRFSSGEAKGIINETIHGTDLFILADISNHYLTYNLHGTENGMSPDDHFQDLKRLIDACNGKARRINVILPLLYEGRQDKRNALESLDCATALQELVQMGVKNVITFDAHDGRIQNAVPLEGFDNFYTSYQFLQALLHTEDGISIEKEDFMVISPDVGGMSRAVFYSNILGVDMGMFYKRRDYSVVNDGKNPIIAHEFLGGDVAGKSVFIVDDMIASGESVLEVAAELKAKKAEKIYISATFGLFTTGFDRFDEAFKEGIIDRVYTTNLIYTPKELIERTYYTNVDVSKYLSLIIDTINHDSSVDGIMNSGGLIRKHLAEYREKCKGTL
ncbi:ribose-phosphate pyrophosphokinase [Anaerocolumna xylanovorans]|uniref:ribose-phosphate diphosphokinase n=1 Tax=Anaerocolumna xylanovorans DSM 12503 TaxID=1121345 RepID=A0A1M7Y2D2_9FIRM|nr:ribose-phosphate pyrophosphokinase [Anaerocolumna xylanovorans]SHO46047.1 ribose-phosphate pyrophosphokinase [Anaerocolumna xylanovorans DSM 12503]